MTIAVEDGKEKGKRVTVTREQFEEWVTAKPGLLLDKHREYVLMLLGRIPPDRDFVNGRKAR